MKRLLFLLATGLILLPTAGRGTETAQGTLFCWSLRFQQGEGPIDETLDLSTISGTPNGELAPWYWLYTHWSDFILDYSGFPITGTLYLDIPTIDDVNDNGFDDNFEVSQGVSGSSIGEYLTALGGGTVSATWSRAAGSKDGTCWLHLVDDTYGDLGTYRHTFEVLEYKGPLSYTPGSNTVVGAINLTQTGDTNSQIAGPLVFVKSATNRFNELELQQGVWTNASAQSLIYTNDTFWRDIEWPTNYYGFVEFDDGDPNTADADYYLWTLSIDDLNDADHDGIPDFSDDPAAPSRRPMLTLTRGSTNLWLSISGEVGRLYEVQEANSLPWTNWQTARSVTLTNDPQTVPLLLPSTLEKYWRARTP
jgi:hypothetical protein